MKKISCWFLLLALLVVGPLCSDAHARTIRLFLIGNSFSQNASRYLPQIVKESGNELIIGRAELGGHSLQQHWSYVEAAEANPEDPKGKAYNGKSLRELLSAGTWDIVTIQQASVQSANVDSYRPYAQKLRDYIHSIQPQAEVVMHQTWAYRNDAKSFSNIDSKSSAKTAQEMWEKSHAAYNTVATELGLRLIPNGDAFWAVNSDPKWGYKKDANFDFANPVYPNLPDQTNSLHAGYSWPKVKAGETEPAVKKLNFDANHSNSAGMYLGGLVWYGFLFGESPEKVKFTPPGVSADFAAFLRQTAAKTLTDKGVKFAPA